MVELEADRTKRLRAAAQGEWPDKPLGGLSADEVALLREWARGSTAKRPWDKLRALAGTARLDVADRLAERLLGLGVWQQRERFENGRWWPYEICWLALPVLQRELGLATDEERAGEQRDLAARLEALFGHELVGEAAGEMLEAGRLKSSRIELLEGLARWEDEQRSGMRQDFALFARPHTKAITPTEWAWLDERLDLAGRRIGRFMPVLWMAGDAGMVWAEGRVDQRALPFVGVPADAVSRLTVLETPPRRYWLIENRACFERQAQQREAGCCLIWTAGRPSSFWLRAVEALLRAAPAPAWVSADADPAGIEIAMAATAPWREVNLQWEPRAMDAPQLKAAPRHLPLNAYDQQALRRLDVAPALDPRFKELLECMNHLQAKAEQEGWL